MGEPNTLFPVELKTAASIPGMRRKLFPMFPEGRVLRESEVQFRGKDEFQFVYFRISYIAGLKSGKNVFRFGHRIGLKTKKI